MLTSDDKSSFLLDKEKYIASQYLNKGYYIGPAADADAMSWMQKSFSQIISERLNINFEGNEEQLFNQIHQKVPVSELNDFRLYVINKFNALPDFRNKYYQIAKPYLDIIVGNELAMQLKVNLSIQCPGDESSLLPTHADTWSGDSPFEVVVWVPLVNCYKTKSMYILPPSENEKLNNNFSTMAGHHSEDLFQSIKDKVDWINIDYGNVLIFNQALPHGNRVNIESESRWSMNCRFKSIFSPYWDKKLGSFFEPITLRAASISGMNYKLPELN
jgi:sporadic carbohydrate cluster 2OG-Fe(II) oxygenase